MPLYPVYSLYPITIDHARGVWLWDDQDRCYLDMYGGHAVISIGHTHPHYVNRLTGQLAKIGFYSNSVRIPQQEELADRLERASEKQGYQLFLCSSGAEANENALKLASFHTGRKDVISFSGAFHGRTALAVALTDNPAIVAPVNQTPHAVQLPFNDPQALHDYFQKNGDTVAAVIVEGIQGVGGIHEASAEFLQVIRQCCDTHGAAFIADSVQCGYGRSGNFFAHDHAGVQADIYTMAKGMGNGFPVAGILAAPHFKGKIGQLGTTFGGNHLACVAALAVLEVMEKEKLQENVLREGNYLKQQLQTIPGLEKVRGRGLMLGFDLPDHWRDLRKNLLFENQVFTGEAKPNTIRLLPSLAIQRSEIDFFLEQLRKTIEQLPIAGS
jgi:acetylornithine/N-succinyldiaminopimelate aminotransferase